MKTFLKTLTRPWGRLAIVTTIVGGLLVLSVGAALASGPPYGPQGGMGTGPMMGGGMMGGMMADADRHFIEMMIPHHEDAIAMADLALGTDQGGQRRASHQEILTLAANIKRTQSAEIAQMRAWYTAWYKTDVPDYPRRGGMMGDDDLATLKTLTGDAFDKAFIAQMVPHHQMAVQMATMTLPRSTHAELQGLLNSIIKAQSDEIAQMQTWYKAWYGVDVPAAPHGMGTMPMGGGPMRGPGNRPGMPGR